MTEVDARIQRASRIIQALRNAHPDDTVSPEAAKQLETLLRGVLRAKAMGKGEKQLLKRLEWAAP